MAQRAHKPTVEGRKLVETLSGYGLPQDQIAQKLGVSLPTLHKYYRKELDEGLANVNRLIGQGLVLAATGWMRGKDGALNQHARPDKGAVTALIFLGKVRLGLSEKTSVELSGPAGGPMQHEHSGGVVLYLPDNGRGDAPEPPKPTAKGPTRA